MRKFLWLNFVYVGPGEKVYHKYDMIIYPKKTQVSKSMRQKLSTKLKGWVIKKQSNGSNEVEEFVPMSISDMGVFCLWSYLKEYEVIVCEGSFQQGSNVIQLVDSIINIFNSLASFFIRIQTYFGWRAITVEVCDKNGYKEVCDTLQHDHILL